MFARSGEGQACFLPGTSGKAVHSTSPRFQRAAAWKRYEYDAANPGEATQSRNIDDEGNELAVTGRSHEFLLFCKCALYIISKGPC